MTFLNYARSEHRSPIVQVVIVAYKSADYIDVCLNSIFLTNQEKIPFEIHIINNSYCDNLERVVRSLKAPNVHLTLNRKNVGFSAGVNQGIAQGDSPYIILVNPDATLNQGFIEKTIDFLETHKDVGLIGPKILDPDGKIQGSARSFPNGITAFFGRNSFLTKFFPNNRHSRKNIIYNNGLNSNDIEVDWVSGACMIIRRTVIEDIGGVDERFFMYWEDADLCRRVWESGWKVVYFRLASACHHVGKSSSQNRLRSIFEFHRSVYLLYKKYDALKCPAIDFIVAAGLFGRALLALFLNIFRVYIDWLRKKKKV